MYAACYIPSIAQLEERETVMVTPGHLKVIGSIPIRGMTSLVRSRLEAVLFALLLSVPDDADGREPTDLSPRSPVRFTGY